MIETNFLFDLGVPGKFNKVWASGRTNSMKITVNPVLK
jgi:hypothetical protein